MEHQEGIMPFTLAKRFGHGSNELTKRLPRVSMGGFWVVFFSFRGPCCLFHRDDRGFMVSVIDFSPSFADFFYLHLFACFCSLPNSLLLSFLVFAAVVATRVDLEEYEFLCRIALTKTSSVSFCIFPSFSTFAPQHTCPVMLGFWMGSFKNSYEQRHTRIHCLVSRQLGTILGIWVRENKSTAKDRRLGRRREHETN